jgi:hypothetical protein
MDPSIVLMHQAARLRNEERLARSLAALAQRTAHGASRTRRGWRPRLTASLSRRGNVLLAVHGGRAR